MGEVDEFDDAVDEGITEGDEGEDQSVAKADDERLDELIHVTAILGFDDAMTIAETLGMGPVSRSRFPIQAETGPERSR